MGTQNALPKITHVQDFGIDRRNPKKKHQQIMKFVMMLGDLNLFKTLKISSNFHVHLIFKTNIDLCRFKYLFQKQDRKYTKN